MRARAARAERIVSLTTLAAGAALGVFSTLAPFFLFNSGLKHLSAAEAGIIASLEPVVAVNR